MNPNDPTGSRPYRAHNFSAGPAMLPLAVLERAQRELIDYGGTGTSVMEMSHRSKAYDGIHRGAMELLRELLAIPEDYAVMFLQGGASLQFTMIPMNLRPAGASADYVITGVWSKKALGEAEKLGAARVAGSSADDGFCRIPGIDELDLDPQASYVHLTSNNTIYGTQWAELPALEAITVVDMSSDILSRPVDWSRVQLAYAGAQKNLGPSGVTLVIAQRELLGRAPDNLPAMLDYRTHDSNDSLFNTPPCWSIYILGLACEWVRDQGGVGAIERLNQAKADLVYSRLDRGGLYRGTAETASRSQMNIPFRLTTEELEARFLGEATAAGLLNLKGHRSLGGLRASIYNAVPRESVEALASFMDAFERRHR